MENNEIIKKNLDLHAEWARFLFEHPETMDKIPEGAQVVILPTDDVKLEEENKKILDQAQRKGVPIVLVRMPTPKPPTPQITVLSH